MEPNKYFKKGFTQGTIGAVIMLVVGSGICVMVLIFVGVLSGTTYQLSENKLTSIATNGILDESFTALNSTAVRLDHGFIQEGSLAIKNSTNVVGLGNFTIDYDVGSLILKNNAYNNTGLTANYTWGSVEVRESVINGIISGFSGLETVGDYFPLMVLAIIITLILALILSLGSGVNGGSSGGAL